MSTDTREVETVEQNTDTAATGNELGYDPVDESADDKAAEPQYGIGDEDDDETLPSPDADDESAPKGQEGEAASAKKPDEETKSLSRDDWSEYGLTEEQARALDAKGSLGVFCDVADQRRLALGRKALEEQAKETGEGKPPAEKTPAEKAATEAMVMEGPFKPKITAEVYDDLIAGDMAEVANHVNQQHAKIQQLEQALSHVLNTFQQQESAAFTERMDAWFNSLGEEFADLVGKGQFGELTKDSPHLAKRQEVVKTMRALKLGFEQDGAEVPSEARLRELAKRAVFGDRVQELARKEVREQARNAQGQFVAKPTHREGKPLSREESAARFADNFYRKKGLAE